MDDLVNKLADFETTEANIAKLEKAWKLIQSLIPPGIESILPDKEQAEYEKAQQSFHSIAASLPALKGWRIEAGIPDIDEIARLRMDARIVGDVEAEIAVDNHLGEPGKAVRECRRRFDDLRRTFARSAVNELADAVSDCLDEISGTVEGKEKVERIQHPKWADIKEHVGRIEKFVGTSVSLPKAWGDLRRHLNFGLVQDFEDIVERDWPTAKAGLLRCLYGDSEPEPVESTDLANLLDGDDSKMPACTTRVLNLQPLGGGAHADTYVGHEQLLDRNVVVKVFRASVGDYNFLLHQAKALARAMHPNVVSVYGIAEVQLPGDDKLVHGMVMEHVDGMTLDARLKGAKLTLTQATEVGLGLCRAIAHIHDEGLAHRDLHPANVLIAKAGYPKIIDILYEDTLARQSDGSRQSVLNSDLRSLGSLLLKLLEHSEIDLARRDQFADARHHFQTIADVEKALLLATSQAPPSDKPQGTLRKRRANLERPGRGPLASW